MLLLALCTLTAQAQEAELIRNGDFELTPRVEKGANATTAWDSRKPVVVVHVDPVSADNPCYAVICCDTLYNEGAGGAIDMVDGTKYDLSIALRNIPAIKAENRTEGNKLIIIQLIDEQCKPIAETTIRVKGQGWQQFNRQFTASATCAKARLAIIGLGCAKIAIDNVSIKKH